MVIFEGLWHQSPTNGETCSNRANHVSAWSASDRILCPFCGKKYVRKPAEIRVKNER